MAVSFPGATSVPYTDAGAFESGFHPRLVHHTTEGSSLPHYSGSAPHLTVDIKRRKIYQHISLDRMAKALVGAASSGIATNGAHAIQVEWIAFSDAAFAKKVGRPDLAVGALTKEDWAYMAGVCRKLEKLCGIARHDTNTYLDRAHPMSHESWTAFTGHCAHQHVPGQQHWDTSSKWRKDLIIGPNATIANDPDVYPGTLIQMGRTGAAVRLVQTWLNKVGSKAQQLDVDGAYGKQTCRRVRTFQAHHKLDADGIVGPVTWRALRAAAKKEK